jgi:hypothetical protein
MWAADLASGETLICRAIKAATISKYLSDAAKFIAGYTGDDPRFVHRGDQRIHPMIQGVLDEVSRYEKIPDKREPHTPKMQSWLRDHQAVCRAEEDSLVAAMADWGALGLVLGPRVSEWAQEAGNYDPHSPRRAPDGDTYAFTWKDIDARRDGNRRVDLAEAIRLPVDAIQAINVTFTWQKTVTTEKNACWSPIVRHQIYAPSGMCYVFSGVLYDLWARRTASPHCPYIDRTSVALFSSSQRVK